MQVLVLYNHIAGVETLIFDCCGTSLGLYAAHFTILSYVLFYCYDVTVLNADNDCVTGEYKMLETTLVCK